MQNIVIAIDSFKGSLSSIQAGNIVFNATKKIFPKSNIKIFPLADGGEGTVDALTEGLHGKIISSYVTGPLGDKIQSRYGYLAQDNIAIIEMADTAGLTLVPENKRNPLFTTTYGLGELILDAIHNGCRKFIIGIGGSATNDCGLGMLSALGIKFFNKNHQPVGIFGKDLQDIAFIDTSTLNPLIKDCSFSIACDVTNPLYGENGCSHIYAPQKGATPDIVNQMDNNIKNFADLIKKQLGLTGANLAGAGAAGGLGFAFHTFLKAQLIPGIELILNTLHIQEFLKNADLLITGEGKIDLQTSMGKAPIGIAKLAKQLNPQIKVIAICGCATNNASSVNSQGIDAYFPIIQTPISLQKAMQTDIASNNLNQTITQVLNLLK